MTSFSLVHSLVDAVFHALKLAGCQEYALLCNLSSFVHDFSQSEFIGIGVVLCRGLCFSLSRKPPGQGQRTATRKVLVVWICEFVWADQRNINDLASGKDWVQQGTGCFY